MSIPPPKEVLVVDDEGLICALLELTLTEAGFVVTRASCGAEALAVLDRAGGAFDALVSDVRLGNGPDGWAVAERARVVAPGIPVVFMTGDSCADWKAKGVVNSVVLQKPFQPAAVVSAVLALTGAPPGTLAA